MTPTVFVSYSHDDQDHRRWVLALATRLRGNGVDTVLDQWNLTLGQNLATFMERGLSSANRVLCICTEPYVAKANDGCGGVGYEKQIMTAEVLDCPNSSWVVPLVRSGTGPDVVPTFLRGRVYVDFRDEGVYEEKYEELLRELLNEPAVPVPPIGPNPFETTKQFMGKQFYPGPEKYVTPAASGRVAFDYSNNNGRYVIGSGAYKFETAWYKASNTSIHATNDGRSVQTISIAKGVRNFRDIEDARVFDGCHQEQEPRSSTKLWFLRIRTTTMLR